MTKHALDASRFLVHAYTVAFAAAALLIAACDGSPSSGADEEEIAGSPSLLLEGSAQLPTANVALMWSSYSGPTTGVLVAVDEDSTYSLEATQAPPSFAFDSSLKRMLAEEGLPDPRVADAVVAGLPESDDATTPDGSKIESMMTGAFVVYVEEPLDSDTFAGKLYGPLGRGYHLLKIVPGPTRTIWAKQGEVCEGDEDDRCASDETHGASGMSIDGWIVAIDFEAAPPLVAVGR